MEQTMSKQFECNTNDEINERELETVSGGDMASPVFFDSTNPLCPEPRPTPGQILNPHKG
jgi:hypothetical protein